MLILPGAISASLQVQFGVGTFSVFDRNHQTVAENPFLPKLGKNLAGRSKVLQPILTDQVADLFAVCFNPATPMSERRRGLIADIGEFGDPQPGAFGKLLVAAKSLHFGSPECVIEMDKILSAAQDFRHRQVPS